MRDKHFRFVLKFALLLAAYFVTARFGLTLNAVSGFATLVWAPTGIAMALLFLMGYRFWPAVTIAAFLVNLVTGASPLVALGIALGNTLEATTGAYLLKRVVSFDAKMERLKDVFGLIFLAAILSTVISATFGVASLWLGNSLSNSAILNTWLAWWVGDMLGALVIAPFIFVWSQHKYSKIKPEVMLESSLYLVLLAVLTIIIFRGIPELGVKPFSYVYIMFPVLMWIALRFGQMGGVVATLVASVVAIWGTVTGEHLSGGALSHRLLLLQSFMGITAVTFLTMAAVVAEKQQSERQQQLYEQRTKQLTKQRMRLLALNRAKDEFISLASHQLRTPATTVKIYSGMLLEDYAGKLSVSQREMLNTAYSNNERQLELIDALLRVARLDAGEIALKKERVDMSILVSEIIKSYNGSFAARNQTVKFIHDDQKYYAKIDKDKIRIVLENLLDNASKYSSAGKEIDVRLEKINDRVAIEVQDNGVGIPKKDTKKLFKKFSRIENPLSSSVDGTGLGLYWAKKIMELHKGTIKVMSKPEIGSTFTVVFPKS